MSFRIGELIRGNSHTIRVVEPSTRVPFRSPEEVARLADGALQRGREILGDGFINPPISIETFVERVTPRRSSIPKMSLNFEEDLNQYFCDRDAYDAGTVLGLTDLATGDLFVDDSLDPHKYPERLAQYRFVLAHELGHYQLHRRFLTYPPQKGRFEESYSERPIIVTRLTNSSLEDGKRDRIEWQANYFASCFLIPDSSIESMIRNRSGGLLVNFEETADGRESANRIARVLSKSFLVSHQTARYRLASFFRHRQAKLPGF